MQPINVVRTPPSSAIWVGEIYSTDGVMNHCSMEFDCDDSDTDSEFSETGYDDAAFFDEYLEAYDLEALSLTRAGMDVLSCYAAVSDWHARSSSALAAWGADGGEHPHSEERGPLAQRRSNALHEYSAAGEVEGLSLAQCEVGLALLTPAAVATCRQRALCLGAVARDPSLLQHVRQDAGGETGSRERARAAVTRAVRCRRGVRWHRPALLSGCRRPRCAPPRWRARRVPCDTSTPRPCAVRRCGPGGAGGPSGRPRAEHHAVRHRRDRAGLRLRRRGTDHVGGEDGRRLADHRCEDLVHLRGARRGGRRVGATGYSGS